MREVAVLITSPKSSTWVRYTREWCCMWQVRCARVSRSRQPRSDFAIESARVRASCMPESGLKRRRFCARNRRHATSGSLVASPYVPFTCRTTRRRPVRRLVCANARACELAVLCVWSVGDRPRFRPKRPRLEMPTSRGAVAVCAVRCFSCLFSLVRAFLWSDFRVSRLARIR